MLKRSKQNFSKSKAYFEIPEEIEDEILEVYSNLVGDESDFYLHQLPDFFTELQIPPCFTFDIIKCINFYYNHCRDKTFSIDAISAKQNFTLQMIKAFTINDTITQSDEIIDIIDINKLIKNSNRLIKFRNSYDIIFQSWSLLIDASVGITNQSEEELINYHLTLPDLQRIKNLLQISSEANTLSDAFLIDMLSCCSTTPDGTLINFDFDKPKDGSYVSFKDFAEILGNLGELD